MINYVLLKLKFRSSKTFLNEAEIQARAGGNDNKSVPDKGLYLE